MITKRAVLFRLLTIIVLPLFLLTNLGAGQDPLDAKVHDESIFEQANNAYKSGNYQAAMDLYSRIQDKNAVVNYNLGNCAYKLGKLGLAHLFWRRAEKNWGLFNRTELLNNLSLLREKLRGQKKDTKSEEVLKGIKDLRIQIASFIRAIPLLFFQIVFILLWIIIFMSMRNLLRRRKKLLIATLFTFIAISGLMLISKYNAEFRRTGIVIAHNAKLLSGPGSGYQVLGFVAEAKEVVIQKVSTGFYKIKINGQIGWISQDSVEEI